MLGVVEFRSFFLLLGDMIFEEVVLGYLVGVLLFMVFIGFVDFMERKKK